ncbi:hypothetical protein XM38_036550 [Halomicronema hongdechloris C2206]|uniref:Uncharacterized protein n=1 Tax=Halomicronema hongdechloris C2206 TaxID=1641165 RepID=A0A1Z3HRD2_9CYAN|nr:hypothetical protein [Halomicronema hongdechloris]ASC72697.1 hypothetical protein XM38_036550 [Halomicronema hongdechloris C2206]
MRLLRTHSKRLLLSVLLPATGAMLAGVFSQSAFGNTPVSQVLNFDGQQEKSQSIIDKIFRRSRGGSTRGPICVITPDGGYIWHHQPLFVWFGGEGELRVQVRGETVNDVRWSDTVSIPEDADAQTLHSIAYDKENLSPGEEYYFEIYGGGDRPFAVPFQLLPQAEWQNVQTALNDLSSGSASSDRDSLTWQRIDYFSSHSYTPGSGITAAGADSETYFFADAVQELFNLSQSAEKDAYTNQIYAELCESN